MLSRISKHLRNINYLDLTVSSDNVVRNIKFLPLGQALRDNISRERGTDQIVREDSFEFLSFPGEYLAKFSTHLKRKNPLEVLQLVNFQSSSTTASESESPGISLSACKVLCSTSLVSSKSAFELFYQLQRQRKIWWMKFVYNPGQIVFANPQRTEDSQTISICLKSAKGFNVELERIGLYSIGDANDGGKTTALQSWFSLDMSVLSFLIDGLPEVDSDDLTLYLHRKLSPHKIALLVEDDLGPDRDLIDLATLINYELGKGNSLNILNRVEDCKGDLEENLLQADQIGIPYSLILGRESLETGLIKLRNRNTTLSEVIHISDVPGYIEQIIHK